LLMVANKRLNIKAAGAGVISGCGISYEMKMANETQYLNAMAINIERNGESVAVGWLAAARNICSNAEMKAGGAES